MSIQILSCMKLAFHSIDLPGSCKVCDHCYGSQNFAVNIVFIGQINPYVIVIAKSKTKQTDRLTQFQKVIELLEISKFTEIYMVLCPHGLPLRMPYLSPCFSILC